MADLELAVDGVEGPSLRADLLTPRVTVEPGQPVAVSVQVLNTTDTIETVRCTLVGITPDRLDQTPGDVTLFPDESTRITLDLWFPPTLPAGRHDVFVAVATGSGEHVTEVPLRIEVTPVVSATLTVEPPLVFAGRRGVFEAKGRNTGNVPVALLVRAGDADRALDIEVEEPSWRLDLDGEATSRIVAKRKRPLTGAPVEHTITVTAEQDDVFETQVVRFRQKALLTPGIITILTLTLIVAIWALAMVFGVRAALAPPPPTKTVPETFAGGITGADLDPTAVGGTFSGTIRAATTAVGLPRVTVEAFDKDDLLVGATATDEEGTFTLPALLPADYRVRIRADGYEDVWWPDAGTIRDAMPLFAPPGDVREGLDVELVGLPATVGGQVIAGDAPGPGVIVEATAVDLLETAEPVTTTTDDTGSWVLAGLPSPATYRITYRATGFDPVELTQPVAGGATLAVNTATLPAAPGTITGEVVNRSGTKLGGVEVVLTRGELEIATKTPTSGEVGFFELPELPTPATYLVTFSLEGYASETIAVRLGPGEVRDDLSVVLPDAFGAISGVLTNVTDDAKLGGAAVTVSGEGLVLETETLTSGTVGGYRVAGLPVPGVYAVTFDLEGYGRQTIEVALTPSAPTAVRDVELGIDRARLVGNVNDDGTGLGNLVVRISDGGGFTLETLTATAPVADVGDYAFDGLTAGTYTVTATRTTSPTEVVGILTVDIGSGTGFTRDAQGRPVYTLDLDFSEVG